MTGSIRYVFLVLMGFGLLACQDENPPPPNPFDAIDYGNMGMEIDPPDSNSLVGLHTFIFSQRCAVPGCHDGNFEPDFRTVQSTYSTLVYHPLVKVDTSGFFNYRVKPFDIDASWLHERITTDDPLLGRMPLYDTPLTSGQVKNIESWINAGAPDILGNVSALPNTQPRITGIAAFLNVPPFGAYRVDTIRDQPYFPFGVLSNNELTIWVDIQDDSTSIGDLMNGEMKFSADPNYFSGALTEPAVYSSVPEVVPDFYGLGMPGTFHWKVIVHTSAFQVGEITFLRYYANDGSHTETMEFPRTEQPNEVKLYMSFFVVQ